MVNLRLRTRLPSAIARSLRPISLYLPPLNFITLHYAYFIGVCLLSSVIFWGSSTPSRSVSYTDSLFLVVSAMTLAGLNTINLSQLNTFQQVILFLLILLGSAIWVSIAVVHVRRKAFERKFKRIVEAGRQRRRDRSNSRSNSRREPSTPRLIRRSLSEGDGPDVRGRAVNKERPPSLEEVDEHMRKAREDARNDPKSDSRKAPPTLTLTSRPIKYIGRPVTNGTIISEKESSSKEEVDEGLRRADEITPASVPTSPNLEHTATAEIHADNKGDNDRNLAATQPLGIDVGVSRRITFANMTSPTRERRRGPLSMQGVGARQNIQNHPLRTPPPTNPNEPVGPIEAGAASEPATHHGFLTSGFIGRNSQFAGLTLAERERLGGVEYTAVSILAVLVPAYFVLWQLFGCIGLGAYVAYNRSGATDANAENPWWVGVFNGVSAFNNSGMSLLDANMVAFQSSDFMLITMGLMILAGNTCYPVFLRLTIWTMYKLMPDKARYHEYKITLRFLLDHPRRCYTNLFPSKHTWWLLVTLIALNGIDWAAFEVLNIGNSTVTSLSSGERAIDGLFQALAVRSGGFYVVSIPGLRIGLLILYVIMMYISVYPVVITMRNSNVYEERSLGIYADDPQEKEKASSTTPTFYHRIKRTVTNQTSPTESTSYFVRQQLRGQLAHDLWWIVLAILFITITETSNFERDPVSYSVFNVVFEVVSAYGCVGISVGLPNVAYSFCGGWHAFSKLVLCAVMIRGRHRGLPVAIDRAVLLPGEHLARAEEEDAMIRIERSQTVGRGVV